MASLEDSAVLKLEGSSRTPTNTPVLNPVVIQNDASAVPNTVRLNGSNYPIWSKVLEMHIAGRGRKGFVIGSTKEPAENSAGYEAWETGNAIVKSFRLRQEGRPVGVYYADLKSVWQELDQRRPIKMECAVDLKTLRDEIQIDRVYAFLAGLDDIFDKVRSDILRTQPLPSIEEVFSVVRREAQIHATMMSGSNNQGGLPSMAMVSRPAVAFRPSNPSNQSLNSRPFTRENKDDLKCTFCGQTRHTEDTCFAKHGKKLRAKERGSGGNNGGRASLAAASPKTKEDETISNHPSQTLLTRSTHDDSSSTAGTVGHVFLASDIEHHAGWILDSGATDHMTYDKNVFQSMTTSHREYIATANVLCISQPLFLYTDDIQTKEIIGRGTKREGLYYVDDVVPGRAHAVRVLRGSNLQEVWLLHRRLGHASFSYLRRLLPSLFNGINESDLHCEVCILAKSHRASFPPSMNKRPFPFDLVHSDVWGPSPVVTSSGLRWFVTFIDDCTRMTWLYVLKNKSDVGAIFRSFAQMVQTQYSSVIKVLRFDNGGEYINFELSEFLRGQGILHETTCPHTPQQNGVAERKNRHILETARALLLGASVPPRFWPKTVTYAVYVINRMPSRVVGFQTPIQVLTQHTPVVSSNTLLPRVFGCVAYVRIQKIHRSKLDPCALRCVFVGYSSHQKGYQCYHPETRHMYVTMDVTFSETEYFYTTVPSTSDHQGENTDGNLSWLDLRGDVTVEQRVEPGTEPILEESQQATIEKDPVVEQPCAEPSIPSLSSSEVPPNTSSLNMPEVSIVNDCVTNPSVGTYKLPPRQNRGVPPDRFSPEGKVKYTIANYVSCNKLAPERQTLVSNMSPSMYQLEWRRL
ncbi:unnamed protein product [Prunus armeniaca]